jgi:CRP/FNR family transcriptional regulator
MNPIDIYIQSMKIMCPSIEDTHLEEFKSSLTIKTFNKGEYVFQVNEKHEFILFITTGLVRAFYRNEKGDEKNAWFVKENEFITDYPSFLQSCPSNYAFQCLENTTAVLLSKKAIIEAYQNFTTIDNYGRKIAEEVVKMMQMRIESLLFLSATDRYKEFLKTEINLSKRISLSQLASYLGIERQTLTRIRKELLHT